MDVWMYVGSDGVKSRKDYYCRGTRKVGSDR